MRRASKPPGTCPGGGGSIEPPEQGERREEALRIAGEIARRQRLERDGRSILFLDIATRTGFAEDADVGNPIPITGSFKAPSPTGSADLGWDFGRTYGHYRLWLVEKLERQRYSCVGFEAPLTINDRNPSTARILLSLIAMTEEVLWSRKIPCVEAHVRSIRKAFCGHAGADKLDVQRCCRNHGYPYCDDNAADAAAGWHYVKCLRDPAFASAATPLFRRQK